MFETIIWATDGSELADSVLPVVEDLARTHGSKVVAVHATQLFRSGRFHGGPLLADDDELRLKIRAQVETLCAAGIAAELEVKAGDREDAAELISAGAAENHAGLIVVGTHGRGAFATALRGSVAKRLVHLAPCPLLVVPPGFEIATERRPEAGRRVRMKPQRESASAPIEATPIHAMVRVVKRRMQ